MNKGMIKRFLSVVAVLFGLSLSANTWAQSCNGRFPNPITDICWSCVFPMSISGIKVENGQEDNGTHSNSAICTCNNPPMIGFPYSFFEPVRIVEVVRKPYCFVSLGGIEINAGVRAGNHGRYRKDDEDSGNTPTSFYQVHWYTNPLFYWLEVLADNPCLEQGSFDVAYITELDPLWDDSKASFLINPDVALFANPLAQAACAADCVAATSGFPTTKLFWCAGCQGSMYPLNGWVGAHVGGVQASTLLVQRMTNKMHRELLVWAASGESGLCGYYMQPIMDKRNYKMQMLYPTPNTSKINGRCCQPFGRSTADWGSMKEFPYNGEDFSYQLFRKRDCCLGVGL
jgi:conjugal transfer pilus assembly protein TraU